MGGERAEEQTRPAGGPPASPPARLFFSRTALKQKLKSVVLSVIQEDTDYTLDQKVKSRFLSMCGSAYSDYIPYVEVNVHKMGQDFLDLQ